MRGDFLQRGGWWVVGQEVLLLAVALGPVWWRGQWQIPALTICGSILLLAAAVCAFAGLIALGRNLTPFPRPSAQARLVQSGIYALIRHPLYTSLMLGSVGWALVWASRPALVGALALAALLDGKARREEQWLQERFPEYREYERRVHRFIPGVY